MNIKAWNPLAFAAVAFLSVFANIPLSAADSRSEPIDAYILLDKSSEMKGAVTEAAEWICSRVIDDLLESGDRVTVWTFSERSSPLVEDAVFTEDGKEALKKAVRGVAGDDQRPNIAAALESLLRKAENRDSPRPIAYVLVASSLIESGSDAAAELLKYSRVEAMPGWKALVVGVGLEERVAERARDYLRSQANR